MADSRDGLDESELDRAIDEIEECVSTIFSHVRLAWKVAAASIHPDLQPLGYKILSAIVRLEQTNAHALADMFEADKSLVSRQVRMLEAANLIASRADPKDGRARVLSPTPEAVERVTAVTAQRQALLRDILRGRPEHEVRTFTAMLRSVSEV